MIHPDRRTDRRRRVITHAIPLALVAVAAFAAGLIVAAGSEEIDAAERFADAWIAQDFGAMHTELTASAQQRHSPEDLADAYEQAQRTATIQGIGAGKPRGPIDEGGEKMVALPLEIRTRSFGSVEGELALPVSDGAIEWGAHLVFPGLEEGERLKRRTTAPRRAAILARDRSPLAEGPASARTTVGAGGIVTGELGAPPAERARQMARQGFPKGTPAGNSGLELAFDGILAGIPGGELLASGGGEERTLATGEPQPGEPVRTTLDPDLQQATADALGDRFGGIAVLDATSGEIRALAGIAFSAPQPPGSTMKIVTTAAVLEEGVAEPSREFPVLSSTPVGGREIANSEEESCGGTLENSFAHSCNTVFAPLGAELGGERLLEEAEQFGFNSAPTLYREDALAATQPPMSTIPDPIGSELDVAVSAIGQGKVLATPLQMASVAQTIANRGVRSPTSLVRDRQLRADYAPVEVTTPEVAKQIRRFMVEVVATGTGRAAALPDVTVAGKTGTAELGPADGATVDPDDPDAEVEQELDAWFTAFAPAEKPKLAVAVMIVNAEGDGGVVAAPIAREVLAAGL